VGDLLELLKDDESKMVRRSVRTTRVRIGGRVAMKFRLKSTSTRQQQLLVDVSVHFVKTRGVGGPQVFKLGRITLGPRERVDLKTRFSLAVHTTRVPGATPSTWS
jgi:hypothetical protein